MIKKCPDCGSLNVEEVYDGEAYCKKCYLHCSVFDLEDATLFDQIKQSPEAMAKATVHPIVVTDLCTGNRRMCYYSPIVDKRYDNEAEAIASTVEELYKVVEDEEDKEVAE